MLLPSALPCDLRRRPSTRSRTPATRRSATPPSDNDAVRSGTGAGNGLFGTCRALQSLLNGSPAPSPRRAKPSRLQSPAQIQTPQSSSTRSRKPAATRPSSPESPRQPKPKPRPRPRGANKRRRGDYESDTDMDTDTGVDSPIRRFSTPKRRRQLPYDLPLGLSQSDFYSLHSPPVSHSPPTPRKQYGLRSQHQQPIDPDAALPSIEEEDEMSADSADDIHWSPEDDRRLVELVLGRFRPSTRDWDACARRLGRNSAAVGQRWHDLVDEGNIGLRE